MARDTHPAGSDRLTAGDLALRLGVDTAWVERLAQAGALDAAADGTFDPGDVHRVRLLKAFEDAGVPLEALVAASDAGQISLRYYGELHPPPSPVSGRSFAEFAASLGEGRRHLGQLFAAFGIAEPDDAVVLTIEDESVIREVLDVVVATGQPDLALRAVRMFGEGARRAADAALGVYGEAVGRLGDDLAGLPVDEQFDKQLRPWARFARQSIPLAGWLSGRHLSRAIDEYSIVESERILQESGFVAERVDAPPAVAFVDLTGFTRLTEERGDDVAAAMAMRLGDVSTDIAEHRGRARGQASRRRGAHAVRRPVGGRDGDPRPPRGAARQRAPDRARGDRERAADQPRRRRLRAHREPRRAHRGRGARRPALGHA